VSNYSIKDIEKLTGIKAHTLRIWEQRYGLISPHRSSTNIRWYDDEQLKRMLSVSILIRSGKRISQISSLTDHEIKTAVQKTLSQEGMNAPHFSSQTDALVVAMMDIDEYYFEKIISTTSLKYGFETVMMNIIFPFLHKVGLLWTNNEISIAQEHFMSNLIRRKILVAIDGQVVNQGRKEKFVLFLPDKELHEIGLLFAHYLIRSRGFQVLYLGQSVPIDDILNIAKIHRPDYLLTYSTVGFDQKDLNQYLVRISEEAPDSPLLICGPGAVRAEIYSEQIIPLLSIDSLFKFLGELKNEPS